MLTDTHPVYCGYISERLDPGIVNHDQATRPRRRAAIDAVAGPIKLGFAELSPDYTNRYDLAIRATSAVADNTGRLASPGPYVASTLSIEPYKLTFLSGSRAVEARR
jgi:hypothetical protein